MTVASQAFDLPWEPVAKARPRVTRSRSGRSVTFTPEKTESAEAALRYLLIRMGAIAYEREVPVRVEVTFYVHRPVGLARRVIHPVRRPDIENYAKLVLDAGNGILWADDAQVVQLHADKAYGDPPRIRLRVAQLGSGMPVT